MIEGAMYDGAKRASVEYILGYLLTMTARHDDLGDGKLDNSMIR